MTKKTALLSTLIICLLSIMPASAQEDTVQANKQKILDTYAAYNAGDHDALYNLVTDPFMMNQGDATLYEFTRDDMIGYDQALLGAMPDIQQNADVVIAQGDWVAMHVTLTGTFTEPFQFEPFGPDSFPPNNAFITWTETDFVHFNADGLVDELWSISDVAVLFGQMGIFPPSEEEDPATPLELPAGYQTLSADELAATFTSGMEERNVSLVQNLLDMGFGVDDSDFYADTYISWNNAAAVSYIADVQVEEDMAFTGMIATAMPDYVIETPVVVAEGDWVAVLGNVFGTFSEDTSFFGMPLVATGEPVYWQLGVIQRYNADGKIVEIWNESDPTSLFVGLGLMSMDEGE